jgi:hypothetical protein
MNKEDIRGIVREVIKECYSNLNEGVGSHAASKNMDKALKWAQKNLPGLRVVDVKSGKKVCPPKDKSVDCYTVHMGGKGIYDLYRFLAKAYGLNKHDIETAVSSNRKIKITSPEEARLKNFPIVLIQGKEWYVDEEREELVFTRNIKTTIPFDELSDFEYEELLKVV